MHFFKTAQRCQHSKEIMTKTSSCTNLSGSLQRGQNWQPQFFESNSIFPPPELTSRTRMTRAIFKAVWFLGGGRWGILNATVLSHCKVVTSFFTEPVLIFLCFQLDLELGKIGSWHFISSFVILWRDGSLEFPTSPSSVTSYLPHGFTFLERIMLLQKVTATTDIYEEITQGHLTLLCLAGWFRFCSGPVNSRQWACKHLGEPEYLASTPAPVIMLPGTGLSLMSWCCCH